MGVSAKRKKSAKRTANPWPERLKTIRKRLGLSQPAAAKLIDAPVSTWRNWEHGRRRPSPMIAKLIELAFRK